MDPLSLTVGISAVCVFLLAIPWILEKGIPVTIRNKDGDQWILGHSFLKLVSVGFVLALLTIIPVALFEDEDYCDFVLVNTFEYHQHEDIPPGEANTTTNITYTYDWECADNPDNPSRTFLKGYTWILWIFGLYFGVFVIFLAIYVYRDLWRLV